MVLLLQTKKKIFKPKKNKQESSYEDSCFLMLFSTLNYTKYSFCIIASEMRRHCGKAAHKFLGQLPAPSTDSALNALQRVARNPRRARNARYWESKMDVLYGCAPCRFSRCVLVRFYILFAFVGACFLFRFSFLFLVERLTTRGRYVKISMLSAL